MPLHAPRGRIKARSVESENDPMAPVDPMAHQCTAHSKQTHQRCRQPAIRGGAVCRFHGGAAPQVKQKAEERLRALVDPALTRLNELMIQTEYPSVAIAATKDVLDRNLGKATETLAVNHSGRIDIAALIRQRKARHDPQP